jgi:hypothetical protein
MENNICECGHLKKLHWANEKKGRCWFDGMTEKDLLLVHEYKEKGCKCEGFKPDNLKYLERLYESRAK